MKLDPDLNIWSSTEELSGRDKGRVFAQRAHFIVGEALQDPASHQRLFRKGRVRRKVLASDIGCDRSALYDNPQIRALLDKVEGRDGSIEQPSVAGSQANESPTLPLIVQSVLDRLVEGYEVGGAVLDDRIVTTDQTSRIAGRQCELPTIILGSRIEPEASDWLRHLILSEAVEPTTAKQYAKILRAFLRHCRQKQREWFSVDDQFLAKWRDGRRGQVDDVQVVSDLGIVFKFYVWAEEHNYLSYHVGCHDKLPPGFSRRDFPISAKRKVARKGVLGSGWTSTLTFRVSKSVVGRRNTPTDEQVTRVHEELLKATYGERDALIASWAEEAGPRRSEILQIRRSDLPTNEALAELIANDENFELRIRHRKRRNNSPLSANPYLLMQTLDWIDSGRADIVRECRDRLKRYRDPDEVFISGKTGKVLTPDAVTKIMSSAFKAAGVKKASLHRLRAKAIVEVIETQIDAYAELGITIEASGQWTETILVRVAEMAGHASPPSLRPYLNFVLARRASTTEAARRQRLAAETRHLQRQVRALTAELEKNKNIVAAARLARSGKAEEADRLLRKALAEGTLWEA